MARTALIALFLVTVVAAASWSQETQTYVSFKGGFYITYPDEWAEVDYRMVDAYLLRDQADQSMLDYDAVLASKSSTFFFSGEYLILTVDTVGELNDQQIDSVLTELRRSFGEQIEHLPFASFLANLKTNTPSYDADAKTVTILNDIFEQQQVVKRNLLVMKFYEKGIATFYFYSPDSTFERSKSRFQQIVASFSTENVEEALPREQVTVADLKGVESVATGEDKKSKKVYLYIGAALVLLMVVILRRLK